MSSKLNRTLLNLMSPEDRSVVAYHEAGHAVMVHAVGWTVVRFTIVPDGEDRGGHVSHIRTPEHIGPAPGSRTERRMYQMEILIRIAGYAAEAIKNEACLPGAWAEWQSAEGSCRRYLRGNPERNASRLLALANRILQRHWFAAEALHHEGLYRDCIPGPEVHAIIAGALREGPASP